LVTTTGGLGPVADDEEHVPDTRFFRSVSTLIQNLAPLTPVLGQSPVTSWSPVRVTPIAAQAGPAGDLPVADRDLDRVDGDRRVDGIQGPGLSSTTLSVILETVSLLTEAP
jgi:hypothetical protein